MKIRYELEYFILKRNTKFVLVVDPSRQTLFDSKFNDPDHIHDLLGDEIQTISDENIGMDDIEFTKILTGQLLSNYPCVLSVKLISSIDSNHLRFNMIIERSSM